LSRSSSSQYLTRRAKISGGKLVENLTALLGFGEPSRGRPRAVRFSSKEIASRRLSYHIFFRRARHRMIVDVPTKVIPIWFIDRWKKENAEVGSSLDVFIERMIKDWELEEIRQSK
jgi:hypothetical protein